MPDINEFTFWKAACAQNPKNCTYPTKVIVTDADSFNEMAHFDHVTAEYENCYRSNNTFLQSDVQSGDVDNDNVGNPDDWITREDIHQMFIGVPHIISESKNHMKPKGSKPPVPRYHIFWKADKEDDPKAYAVFKERLHKHFPFLDPKALDAARYFDGADNPNAVFYPGTITINEYLNRIEAKEQAENEPDFDEPIMEGTRNSTMFRFAVRTLKRLGNTEEARERFRNESDKCCPPLDTSELNGIWKSALKYYGLIRKQPGYILPEQYNSSEEPNWEQPIPFEEIAAFKEIFPMQLYVDDVTPEKLISIIAEHGGIASVISAEGGIFDQLACGMYSKAVNIDVFLKGHAGDTTHIDRIGRNSESIASPALIL